MTLDDYRKDFEVSASRSVSMPIAGTIIWAFIAFISTQFDSLTSTYFLQQDEFPCFIINSKI
jgi:hypothetical protein